MKSCTNLLRIFLSCLCKKQTSGFTYPANAGITRPPTLHPQPNFTRTQTRENRAAYPAPSRSIPERERQGRLTRGWAAPTCGKTPPNGQCSQAKRPSSRSPLPLDCGERRLKSATAEKTPQSHILRAAERLESATATETAKPQPLTHYPLCNSRLLSQAAKPLSAANQC